MKINQIINLIIPVFLYFQFFAFGSSFHSNENRQLFINNIKKNKKLCDNLFIVGDSHSVFFHQSGIMRCHWTGPIHVATIYQLLKLGLNLYRLQEELACSDHYLHFSPMVWQCPSGRYDVPNIKKGDYVIFCFGFNDVQKNIHKYASDRAEIEIFRLIHEYVGLLKEYESKYQIVCIPMSIPPNPSPSKEGDMNKFSYGISGDFLVTGSSEERNSYIIYANSVLKDLCELNGLNFFNIYNEISDENGFLKKDYSEDYVHLNWNNTDLVEKIRNHISNFFTTRIFPD